MGEIQKITASEAFKETMKSFVGFLGAEALSVDDTTMMTHSRWVSEEAVAGGAAALGSVLKGHLSEYIAAPPDASWVGPGGITTPARALTLNSGFKTAYNVIIMPLQEGKEQAMIDFAVSKASEFKAIDGLVDITSFIPSPTQAVVCAGYVTKAQLEAATPMIMPIMKEMLGSFGAGPPTMFTTEVGFSTFDFSAAVAYPKP